MQKNTDLPSEANIITELIYLNLKRIACYTTALAFETNDMAKRIYNCMIGESMNNVEELNALSSNKDLMVEFDQNDLPINPSLSVAQVEAYTCSVYESMSIISSLRTMVKHTIQNQYKELKVSLSIIKQHYSRFPLTVAAQADSRTLAAAS